MHPRDRRTLDRAEAHWPHLALGSTRAARPRGVCGMPSSNILGVRRTETPPSNALRIPTADLRYDRQWDDYLHVA